MVLTHVYFATENVVLFLTRFVRLLSKPASVRVKTSHSIIQIDAVVIGRCGRAAIGVSLQAVIVLALPMVAVQAFLLDASYAERNSAIALVGTELPGR